MPDQLSPPREPSVALPGAGRSGLPSALRHVLLPLVAAAAWGAVLGAVWEWVWTPPSGAAWRDEWYLDASGLSADVGATGWFTVLGLLGGLVYGLGVAWLGGRRPLLTFGVLVLGSLLAVWVMFHVGHALGPPDPHVLARGAEDLTAIPGDLRLAGAGLSPWPLWFESSAFTALPFGALLGLIGVYLGSRGPSVR